MNNIIDVTLIKQNQPFSKNTLFQNSKNKVDYAIISAMPEELEFFMEEFSNSTFNEVNIGEFTFKIYDYQKNKILIAHTGMGTAFAASIFTLIYSYFNPEFFLIAGTAGAIKKELRCGDVVVAEKAFEAEIQDAFTILKNTPFESCLTHPVNNKSFPSHYSADPELLQIFDSLNLDPAYFHKGTVVSSNAFPAPRELYDKIKRFNPYSIDMETSAFYQIAWLLNCKALAIRGISNVLDNQGADEKVCESDVKGSSLAAARILLAILTKSIYLKNQSSFIASKQENEVTKLIQQFNLTPHPEGGYFSLNYKSNDTVKPSDTTRYDNEMRNAGTSIFYLLDKENYSAWHVLKSDEIWHFYKGTPLKIYQIDPQGVLSSHILGDPFKEDNATFQVCIKAGNYFAAENIDKAGYCLVGCTVAPGFEYKDFELADQYSLINKFPQHKEIIERLISSTTKNQSFIDNERKRQFLCKN